MFDKFMAINGEILSTSTTNLALDLHKEGKIEFIASASPKEEQRRERDFYFRHNGRLLKMRARSARYYFLALVNERPRESVLDRAERYDAVSLTVDDN